MIKLGRYQEQSKPNITRSHKIGIELMKYFKIYDGKNQGQVSDVVLGYMLMKYGSFNNKLLLPVKQLAKRYFYYRF